MIKVKAPRYRDRTVLLARYRLPAGQGVDVEILTGAYKGVYKVSNQTVTWLVSRAYDQYENDIKLLFGGGDE